MLMRTIVALAAIVALGLVTGWPRPMRRSTVAMTQTSQYVLPPVAPPAPLWRLAGSCCIPPRTSPAYAVPGDACAALRSTGLGLRKPLREWIWGSAAIGLASDLKTRSLHFRDVAMNAGSRSEQTLAAAMAHHRAGRLTDAERLYRLRLRSRTRQCAGVPPAGGGRASVGTSRCGIIVGRAVMLDPGFAEAHNDRGVILAANGLFADALACFEQRGGA